MTGPASGAHFDRAHLIERIRLTFIGLGLSLLGIPVALVLAVVWLVALPLSVVAVGFVLLIGVIPAARGLADLHRAVSGSLLGVVIPSAYVRTAGLPVHRKLRTWLRDPARWRDFGFLWYSASAGFVLSLVPAGFLAVVVTHGVGAVVDGDDWFWWALVLLDVPLLLAWWYLTPYLVRARAKLDRAVLGVDQVAVLERRVAKVEETRAEALDQQAAEIRRIERDLHDGAQARIAAVGMTVGLAEKVLATDPDTASALLREARESTLAALEDMRTVVRGILPPTLADRGLPGAVEALVVPLPIPVTVAVDVPRLPAPVESAAYFAVAECVANLAKHSAATRAWIVGSHDGATLRVLVGDDGRGGATADGAGLSGIARRLAVFDGMLSVESPPGEGTVVTMELPCRT